MSTQVSPRVVSSFGKATDADHETLARDLTREKEWYAGIDTFANNADIQAAVRAGRLQHVSGSDDYEPILRLRHNRTDIDQLPFTTNAVAVMIYWLGERWRSFADDAGIHPSIRLSLSSLVRTVDYQEKLAADPTKLATTDSTHTKRIGGAADFDLSGYYVRDERGLVSVRRSTSEHEIIRSELISLLGERSSPVLADTSEFNPDVSLALKAAAYEMHEEGFMNVVVEFPGQKNECLHTAVHPSLFRS